jgi:hypothetical protein
MDFLDNIFNFDHNCLQPEDLNPSLKSNYIKDVSDYYSEPPIVRKNNRFMKKSPVKCEHCEQNKTLHILIILLIIITVVQWFIIMFGNSTAPVTINNIMNKPPEQSVPVPEVKDNVV